MRSSLPFEAEAWRHTEQIAQETLFLACIPGIARLGKYDAVVVPDKKARVPWTGFLHLVKSRCGDFICDDVVRHSMAAGLADTPFARKSASSGRPGGLLLRGSQSGRVEARTGLRMMPTFPRPSLSFRTAGFPRYGWKAGFPAGPSQTASCLSLLPTYAGRSLVCHRL